MPFLHKRKIRFSHCDPTGILYFPHVFDFVNATVEDWFESGLGMPFPEFHLLHRLGNPVVSTDCEFIHPCRFGEERMRLRHRTAMISLDRFRAIEIPAELRARAEGFLLPEPSQAPAPRVPDLPGAAPPNAFRSRQLVRYFHCDPGGIVYFPRFFDMFNVALEDWFAEALACPWGTDLIGARQLSTISLAIRAEFLRACRLGEVLDFDLWPTRLGRSSIQLALAGRAAGAERLRAAWTICLVSREQFRSAPIPGDLRARMQSLLPVGT